MFPTLYHFYRDMFGIEIPALQILNTFGFFVALSIAGAFWAMSAEMRRRTVLGQFQSVEVKTIKGTAYPISDYILNGFFAFIFGYKILYLMFPAEANFVPQEHIFTSEGSVLFGLISLLVVLGWRYYGDKKQRLPEPQIEIQTQSAEWHMGNITTVALLSGFAGAKLFHILENPSGLTFTAILDAFFSTGGWTFYGGLVCGAAGVLVYCKRKGISLLRMLDAGGPAMMLSYGIGRFGCQFSGDGDWGIAHTSPKPFSWLPDWVWAYRYPHNVLGGQSGGYAPEGMVPITGCEGDYCYQLAVPVYPTPLYEALLGLILFFVLWKVLRFKSQAPGKLFAWYMVFAGAERFLVETIREHGDSLYRLGSLVCSQAQLISFFLMLIGAWWLFKKQPASTIKPV
ncbi:MAG: prolipoprotein diacylglyceryl transferase [Sphingomonadales bacterium]|nr:prolipoprotein diacylglyceryl transferase [Sphingomonadales bacterium]